MKSVQLLYSGEERVNFSSSIVFLLATSPKIIEKHLPTFLSPFPLSRQQGLGEEVTLPFAGWGGVGWLVCRLEEGLRRQGKQLKKVLVAHVSLSGAAGLLLVFASGAPST